ncbi:hypothetical protein PROFUN_00949 [Planoprotostelium fungivorum]|uniref:Uncharacterized protein n=1 Tax=Planoprotostelium fungivorum TaxID=1890364 RepID=A0A2P6N4A5_9EUKA|nr:hypothetical protein PROFUN_00949 [Planoprotostelium fungivorum]
MAEETDGNVLYSHSIDGWMHPQLDSESWELPIPSPSLDAIDLCFTAPSSEEDATSHCDDVDAQRESVTPSAFMMEPVTKIKVVRPSEQLPHINQLLSRLFLDTAGGSQPEVDLEEIETIMTMHQGGVTHLSSLTKDLGEYLPMEEDEILLARVSHPAEEKYRLKGAESAGWKNCGTNHTSDKRLRYYTSRKFTNDKKQLNLRLYKIGETTYNVIVSWKNVREELNDRGLHLLLAKLQLL